MKAALCVLAVVALAGLCALTNAQSPPEGIVLGDELTSTEFVNTVNLDNCAELTDSSAGYYFEGGAATGLTRDRCSVGGTCQCRQFTDGCDNGSESWS
ncbi:hypothetical protein PTSG_11453 [Salpingoeca rosetta]|uniref:Uncharacterized protein n=1 Tax=Salpingoeca rosetta (strain ATCC 50818 / BSB-021) TaxID=946362 RepID=F2UTH6_SALR5|nr:uncharacterized protein PTSG_11453 [Salpingoeca rosetta]EGD83283.1 hypothetical protein PTSG_11453 [Salpingoeca rosetta]|eukprot:XP_004987529.1 hypothetical protein PTSG_11453 [Salpingoeca rosetta]